MESFERPHVRWALPRPVEPRGSCGDVPPAELAHVGGGLASSGGRPCLGDRAAVQVPLS